MTAWRAGGLLPQAVEIVVETPRWGRCAASSRCPPRGHHEKQRGMALLMVLLLMSLMAIVAININDNWQRSLARTQSQQDRLKAKWLLLGGRSTPNSDCGSGREAQGLGHQERRSVCVPKRGGDDTPAPRRCLFQPKRPDPRRRPNGGRE
ncbi:hypothetical protein M8494_20570 [Serratia ureilytica]